MGLIHCKGSFTIHFGDQLWPGDHLRYCTASPPKNYIFFNSTSKEILNFYKIPLNNSISLQPGVGRGGGKEIKILCNTQRKIAIPASHKCTSYMVRYRPSPFRLKSNLKNNLSWVGAGVRDVGLKRLSKYLFRDDEFRGQDL